MPHPIVASACCSKYCRPVQGIAALLRFSREVSANARERALLSHCIGILDTSAADSCTTFVIEAPRSLHLKASRTATRAAWLS